jgi:hypothetical protein
VIGDRCTGFFVLLLSALAILSASNAEGQTTNGPAPSAAVAARKTGADTAQDGSLATQPEPGQPAQTLPESPESERERAARELKQQEHQRILGVVPNFSTTEVQSAAPLTPKQKFHLALRSAVDPYQFFVAAAGAGIGQAENSFRGYGQEAGGYGKRFGAGYADEFSGSIWGGAVFPILLHEDPRYFRKGRGSFERRFAYAMSTAFWSKRDNGTWGPNYSNFLGKLAAGGLSNLYYPSSDRGASLTIERALTVSAEGAFGAVIAEFLPDMEKRFLHKRRNKKDGTAEAAP